MTGFSVVLLPVFTFSGIVLAGPGPFFVVFLFTRPTAGPAAEGVYTLLAILSLPAGVTGMGPVITGEHTGCMFNKLCGDLDA
jgi:hypothetical protein